MISTLLQRQALFVALLIGILLPSASAQKKDGYKELGRHKSQVQAIVWMKRSERLVTGTAGGVITSWHVKSGKALFTNKEEKTPVVMLGATRDDKMLMCGREGVSGLQHLDPESGEPGAALAGHGDQTLSVGHLDGNSRWIFTGSTDGIIERVALKASDEPAGRHLSFTADCGAVRCMIVSPDGKTLGVAGQDNVIRILRIRDELSESARFAMHTAPINSIDCDARGALFASGSEDHNIMLWTHRGRHVRTLEGHAAAVTAVEFGRNGRVLATGDKKGIVKVWDLKTFTYLTQFNAKDVGAIHALAFSPDGKSLAAAAGKKKVVIWEVPSF